MIDITPLINIRGWFMKQPLASPEKLEVGPRRRLYLPVTNEGRFQDKQNYTVSLLFKQDLETTFTLE